MSKPTVPCAVPLTDRPTDANGLSQPDTSVSEVERDPSKKFKVAIIGGGIAGLALAIALYHRGIDITVYERAAAFGEIGAGVSFQPNAIAAMKICHPGVYEAFERVCTRNTWPEKQKTFFDYVKGYDPECSGQPEIQFSIINATGQNAVHRAHFLDELVRLLPKDIAAFGKNLVGLEQNADGVTMRFQDGTSAVADAVIGCDGIKSRVRRCMFGDDHPCALPKYTHKYAYRGLVPVDEATKVVGPEMGQNSFMHLGPRGHMLTFPVAHGKILNIVAFHQDDGEWPDIERLTRPGKREEALRDFEGWSKPVRSLLEMCNEELSVWAIFDLQDEAPTFVDGRIALMGDAAHATSPHHGSGAGFCIEDAAVMASLLGDSRVTSPADLGAALRAYNDARLERGHWLPKASRRTGEMYDWGADGKENDMKMIEQELAERHKYIFGVDIPGMCRSAIDDMAKELQK